MHLMSKTCLLGRFHILVGMYLLETEIFLGYRAVMLVHLAGDIFVIIKVTKNKY